MTNKYRLVCKKCGHHTTDFSQWFAQNQQCPQCGSNHAEVEYTTDYEHLKQFLTGKPDSFWHYFDFLPLNEKKNIVSCGEGAIPIEEWNYLEDYARQRYGIDCKALVYRNDMNGGTQTFKDVAASMAGSLFKECGVSSFCVASTGNTATAYGKYLSLAGVKFTVFVPQCVAKESVEEIRSYGQNVVIADGDYAHAKKMAADYAKNSKTLISAGNIDPIRVEAKRTMVFEFLRQTGKMPDVYFQAVSGGTGPIAVDKGVRELQPHYPHVTLPRMLLVQQDLCDPMVQAWEKAEKSSFAEGYERDYPVIENPKTNISILSTGNPGMFPILAPIVRKSCGSFMRVKENSLLDIAKEVYRQRHVCLGPASIVCIAGFYKALEEGKIKNNETLLLNIGESAHRAIDFAEAIKKEQ